MDMPWVYTFFDLLGTLAFALSGAIAARQRGLDLFGIVTVAFCVACGGGIVRDVCVGAVPAAGLLDVRYLAIAIGASLLTILAYAAVQRISQPVQLFDALGLGFFAVAGAHKAWLYTGNPQLAVMMGVLSAVGGGVIRDILLNRTPQILEKEVYALAALLAALIQMGGDWAGVRAPSWSALGMLAGVGLRLMALRFKWNLPRFTGDS
ncbi:trimeric intracellular cation channel family protein [Pseudomonas sp. MWU16-30317]|uniref:trimeric intracellular cation channel family protein n=1 Tax=Pseudomonas sp. MWU16-30317 TaxID=2878095 RepID=UPI001CFA581B|nr:trimeric intracellular cation channel family protein [Pseudomonas sp. MWU16-30317]